MGEMKNCHKTLVKKREQGRPFGEGRGDVKHRQNKVIKIYDK
jgi:hypothetical protein